MAHLWNDYIDTQPFTPTLEGDGDGVYIFRVWEEEPPPLALAVATGEWLYNLRSALDYKAECDSRRPAGKPYPRRESKPVEWTDPQAGKRANRDRFVGTDSPPERPEA